MDSSPEDQSLFQALPDPAFRLDRHGTILDLNAAARAELPPGASSLVGLSIQDTWCANGATGLMGALAEVATQGGTATVEYCAAVHDLKTHHEVRLTLLAGGEVLALIRDITDARVTESSLRESDAQFRLLANHITDALWIRSPDMREVWYVSPAFERIWGRPATYLYAHPHEWVEFIVPEDREEVLREFSGLTGDLRSLDIEYRIARPDGERRWVRVRGFQVRDEQDKLICHTGIVTDTTERKLAQAELEAAQKQLIQAREADLRRSHTQLETFAQFLSHDLRAPLTAMSSFSQLLTHELGEVVGERALHYLSRIRANAGVAERFIDDLLMFEGVARAQLDRETVELGAMVRDLLASLQAAQPLRQVATTVAEHLPVHADRNLVKIALDHLLSNAWAYTDGDGASIEFGSQAGQGGGTVYYVRDNGRGFDMAYAGKLFKAPQRLHRDAEPRGTGLGLMVVGRIIGRHGGRVWAESSPTGGSTFFFTLPSG